MAESRVQGVVVCLGIFAVMALSNAIVPVLPEFAETSAWQGAIYAAYFFGAFVSTLPGGVLTDRYGTSPVLRSGLFMTVISGILLFVAASPVLMVFLRAFEGIGAGLFVAAALAYVNSRTDHVRMSGYYMAMLNLGLVASLLLSGWLAVFFSSSVVANRSLYRVHHHCACRERCYRMAGDFTPGKARDFTCLFVYPHKSLALVFGSCPRRDHRCRIVAVP